MRKPGVRLHSRLAPKPPGQLTYFRRLAKAMAAMERTSLHQWCINRPAREAISADVRNLLSIRSPP